MYGEATLPAGFLAALGVATIALTSRRPFFLVAGGGVALIAFLASLNVVALQLVESMIQIGAIAVGGEWPAWYIDAHPIYWIVAPFSGILLGADPFVSESSILVGASIMLLTTGLAASSRNLRLPALGLGVLSLILIGYVEVRDYAYGEHKVLQMLGPSAFALACICLLVSTHHRVWALVGVKSALAVLLVVSSIGYAMRVNDLISSWQSLHGLSKGFSELLEPVSRGDVVLLDDQGAPSVEKFQKTHYLGFLIHEKGARMVMPKVNDDQLRGGYLRGPAGNTLASSEKPRWLLQLRSEGGLRSMTSYSSAKAEGDEYRLIDLSTVPGAAVAADGWFECEGGHCWTLDGFEIETVVTTGCTTGVTVLNVQADFFSPPGGAVVSAKSEAGLVASFPAEGAKVLQIPLRDGWDRISFSADWPTKSPAEVDGSNDDRRLFAMVTDVSVACIAAVSVAN
jgi:hypothetical protein